MSCCYFRDAAPVVVEPSAAVAKRDIHQPDIESSRDELEAGAASAPAGSRSGRGVTYIFTSSGVLTTYSFITTTLKRTVQPVSSAAASLLSCLPGGTIIC